MIKPVPHLLINEIEYKLCTKCKNYLIIKLFTRMQKTFDGLHPSCKECNKLYSKNYVPKKKPDKIINSIIFRYCSKCNFYKEKLTFPKQERTCKDCIKIRNAKYRNNNLDSIKKYANKYRKENKENLSKKRKQWEEKNKESLSQYGKNYRIKHKEKLSIYDREKHHKYKLNINYRLTKNLRRRVLDAIKNHPKITTTLNLIGCDINSFKSYIQNMFTEGMTWDNYGKWHLDHIKPCSSFDLSKEEDQKKCFHYTNMQPLWAIDNLIKGKKN